MTSEPGATLPDPARPGRELRPLRRVLHAGSGLLFAWGPAALGVERAPLLGILGGLFAVLLALDVARLRAPRLNDLFFRAFPALASSREVTGVASSTWYVLGVFLVYLLFPSVAVPAILVLALADPTASVVGRTWGRARMGTGTVEGTLSFFVVASAILWSFSGAGGLAVALVVSLAEPLPLRLDDNLLVPVLTAAALAVSGV